MLRSVDAGDAGTAVLTKDTVLGPSSTAWTLESPDALAGAFVGRTRQDVSLRATRRVEIKAPRGELPEPLLRALEEAIELFQLPRGWNSHGAEPVSDAAFKQTVEFLATYLVAGVAAPALVPTVRGGTQLEWHRRGVDIEVEVGPDGLVSWCAEDQRTAEEVEAALAGHEETIRAWLRRASG